MSCMGGSPPQQQCLDGGKITSTITNDSPFCIMQCACNEGLTKVCEHEEECDEEDHPARDHLRGHKESQPGEANLEIGRGKLDRRKTLSNVNEKKMIM